MPKLKIIQAGPTANQFSGVSATASSFGAGVGEGLQNLGQGMQVLQAHYQKLQDEASILEADNIASDLEFQSEVQFQDAVKNTPQDSTEDVLGQQTTMLRSKLDEAISGLSGEGKKFLSQKSDHIFNKFRMRMYGAEIDRGNKRQVSLVSSKIDKSTSAVGVNPDTFISKAVEDIRMVQNSNLPEEAKAQAIAEIPVRYAVAAANGKLEQAGTSAQVMEFVNEVNSSKWDSVLTADKRLQLRSQAASKMKAIKSQHIALTAAQDKFTIRQAQDDLVAFSADPTEAGKIALWEKYKDSGARNLLFGKLGNLRSQIDQSYKLRPAEEHELKANIKFAVENGDANILANMVGKFGHTVDGQSVIFNAYDKMIKVSDAEDKDSSDIMFLKAWKAAHDGSEQAGMMLEQYESQNPTETANIQTLYRLVHKDETTKAQQQNVIDINDALLMAKDQSQSFTAKDQKQLNLVFGQVQPQLDELRQTDPSKWGTVMRGIFGDSVNKVRTSALPNEMVNYLMRSFNGGDNTLSSEAVTTIMHYKSLGIDTPGIGGSDEDFISDIYHQMSSSKLGYAAAHQSASDWKKKNPEEQRQLKSWAHKMVTDKDPDMDDFWDLAEEHYGWFDAKPNDQVKRLAHSVLVDSLARTGDWAAANGAAQQAVNLASGYSNFGDTDSKRLVVDPIEKLYPMPGYSEDEQAAAINELAIRAVVPEVAKMYNAGLSSREELLKVARDTGWYTDSELESGKKLGTLEFRKDLIEKSILYNYSTTATSFEGFKMLRASNDVRGRPTYNVYAKTKGPMGVIDVQVSTGFIPDYKTSTVFINKTNKTNIELMEGHAKAIKAENSRRDWHRNWDAETQWMQLTPNNLLPERDL